MEAHASSVAVRYRVKCEDNDPDNEYLIRGPGGNLPKQHQGRGFKWVDGNTITNFLAPYSSSIHDAVKTGDFDAVTSAIQQIPYYEDAEAVIIKCTMFHIGGRNLYPRSNTTIECGFEFKNGAIISPKQR